MTDRTAEIESIAYWVKRRKVTLPTTGFSNEFASGYTAALDDIEALLMARARKAMGVTS